MTQSNGEIGTVIPVVIIMNLKAEIISHKTLHNVLTLMVMVMETTNSETILMHSLMMGLNGLMLMKMV